jgi:hypothetical protein
VPSTVEGYRIGVSSAGIETDADINRSMHAPII